MPLKSKKQAFKEFAAGELHSGKGGPLVTSRKQAIAIALSVGDRDADDKGKKAKSDNDEDDKRRKLAESRLGKGARMAPKR